MNDSRNAQDARYVEAKRYVEALKGFYIHALVAICVISGLIGLNMTFGHGWWVLWPMLGWGIGLAMHALAVFAPTLAFGRDWQERKIAELLKQR